MTENVSSQEMPILSELSSVLSQDRIAQKSQSGGEGGIRTPDTVARMPHFECGAIDHSATSPWPDRAGKTPVRSGGYVSKAAGGDKGGAGTPRVTALEEGSGVTGSPRARQRRSGPAARRYLIGSCSRIGGFRRQRCGQEVVGHLDRVEARMFAPAVRRTVPVGITPIQAGDRRSP
jgi:hypothetical protein